MRTTERPTENEDRKMPNHVTTVIKASKEVIASTLNERGNIDFNKVVPFSGEFEWSGVCCDAETAAEKIIGKPLDSNPLLSMLQADSRERADISKLTDEGFEQFIQMLRNHRKTGFMHSMDFARDKWGTKWNAYSQSIDLAAGVARFETAWSFPEPILICLSEKFPDSVIEAKYADEDIGSNCGSITFIGGVASSRNESGRWRDMSPLEREMWRAFAYEVTGREPDQDEDAT